MTTITIDRAVVEQALEALSLALSDVDWRANSPTQPVIHKAYTALVAALAQQGEPEGSVCARCGALAFDPLVPQQDEPVDPVATLTAQRDALLEALKEITPSICHVSIVPEEKCAQCGRIARARAVIKMAEETK